jgi:hypothetical protein
MVVLVILRLLIPVTIVVAIVLVILRLLIPVTIVVGIVLLIIILLVLMVVTTVFVALDRGSDLRMFKNFGIGLAGNSRARSFVRLSLAVDCGSWFPDGGGVVLGVVFGFDIPSGVIIGMASGMMVPSTGKWGSGDNAEEKSNDGREKHLCKRINISELILLRSERIIFLE